MPRGQRIPAGLVRLQPRQRRTSPHRRGGENHAQHACSALGGVCVSLKAPSPRGAALLCRRRASGAAEPGVLEGAAPARRPSGGGGRWPGAGGAGRPSRSGPGPRSPAGQVRARPRREAQPQAAPVPLRQRPGAGGWEAASGWEPAGGGGRWSRAANPVLPAGWAAAHSLAAPSLLLHSLRLLSAASRPSRPRPGCRPAGRAPRLRVPGRTAGTSPSAFPGPRRTAAALSGRRPSAGLGCSDPRGAEVRKRGHPGLGLSASGAPRGAGSYRSGLDRAKLGPYRAQGMPGAV